MGSMTCPSSCSVALRYLVRLHMGYPRTFPPAPISICLLRSEAEAIAFIGSQLNVFPSQLQDVTDTQARETRKQRSLFQHRVFAWGIGKFDDFLLGEILLVNIFLFECIKVVVDVFMQVFVVISLLQHCTERCPEGSYRVFTHPIVWTFERSSINQVQLELLAELNSQVAKGAFAATKVVEVLINGSPLVALLV